MHGGGLVFEECNDHLLALFLIKPHIPLVCIFVDTISNKGKVTWGATRNNFANCSVINIFNSLNIYLADFVIRIKPFQA